MKRLIVMRHAKSSWDSGAPTDHARPLNGRGRRDAPRIGAALRDCGWVPEHVVSSDAERTRQTWAGVASELDAEIDVEFTRELYHGGFDEIAAICAGLGEDLDCAMVLGHNPGFEDAVTSLTGIPTTMTTANCALLEAEGDWDELMAPGAWRRVDVLRPRELDD